MAMISQKLLKPRPQELGKIKIGGVGEKRRAQSGREYQLPVKYDHFVVTTRHRGPDGNFLKDEQIHSKLPENPTELPGILMYPTPEENFHAEMVQYDGRTKVVTCDGEERTDIRRATCMACPRLKDPDFDCGCKPYMRLHIQLWDSPMMGYHVFRSTGWETTNNIQTALREIHDRFGTLYHAPVKLVLYPASVNYEEGGKAKTSEAFMVGLVLASSMEQVSQQMVNAKRLMETTRHELKALSGQVLEEQAKRDVEEAEEIAKEYFPDRAVQASVRSQEKLDALKKEMEAEGPVVDADFEIEEDEPEEKAEPGVAVEEPQDAEPATEEPEPDAEALRFKLAELMGERAPHLLKKGPRTKWTARLVGKNTPNHCSEFELQQLIAAVENGDTDPEAPAAPAEQARTPFDEDEEEAGAEQSRMPV